MHGDDGVPVSLGGVGDHRVTHDAGVVDHACQGAERRDRRIDHVGDVVPGRYRPGVRQGLTSGSLDFRNDLGGRAGAAAAAVPADTRVVDDDGGALFGQRQAVRAADAAAAAGDQDDAAL